MEFRKSSGGVSRLASWISIALPARPTRGSAPGLFHGTENHGACGLTGHGVATRLDRSNLGREERLILNKPHIDFRSCRGRRGGGWPRLTGKDDPQETYADEVRRLEVYQQAGFSVRPNIV